MAERSRPPLFSRAQHLGCPDCPSVPGFLSFGPGNPVAKVLSRRRGQAGKFRSGLGVGRQNLIQFASKYKLFQVIEYLMKAGVPCPPDIKRKLDRNNSRLIPSRRRDDRSDNED